MYSQSSAIPPHRSRSAFTLVELLVVTVIIMILMSMLIPALQAAKAKGQDATCRSNLKQLVVACIMRADDNDSELPGASSTWHISLRSGGYLPNDWPQRQYTFPNGTTEWTSVDGRVNGSFAKRPPNLASVTMCPATNLEAVFQVDDSTRPYYYDMDYSRHLNCGSYLLNSSMTITTPANWGQNGVQTGRYLLRELELEAEHVGMIFDGVPLIGWGSLNTGLYPAMILRHSGHYNAAHYDGHVASYTRTPRSSPNYNYYPWWPRRSPVTAGNRSHPYNPNREPWEWFD